MSKIDIIETIVGQYESNPEKMKGMFGTLVIEACQKELNREIDIKKTLENLNNAIYLVDQIELCDEESNRAHKKILRMRKLNEDGFPFPYTEQDFDSAQKDMEDFLRQKNQYLLNLKTVLDGL